MCSCGRLNGSYKNCGFVVQGLMVREDKATLLVGERDEIGIIATCITTEVVVRSAITIAKKSTLTSRPSSVIFLKHLEVCK